MATTKPNMTRIWAEGAPVANIEDPDVTSPGKFDDGWVAEIPPFENFNFLQQLFTQGLAYQNENGIGEWDTDTIYPQYGLARGSDGIQYQAVIEQTANDPITDDGTNWIPFLGGRILAPSLEAEQVDLITGILRQQVGVAVTITAVGTLATVTHVDHGYTTGRNVNAKGANETEYNGYFTSITVLDSDRYTFVMTGSPASPATGTITARSPEQYDWVIAAGHVPTGVDTSSPIIATNPYILVIPFLKTYTKVLSILVGPDEEMASRFGMAVGASVSLDEFSIKMSISRTLAAAISYNGASWDIDYGLNQGGTESGMVNITDVTHDGTRLILTHDAMLGDNIQVSPVHISGVTVAYIPVIESRTTTTTKIRFINPSTGTYATTLSVNMSFQLGYNYHSDYPWNGSAGDADATEFDDGNIWILGTMQV